jgi:pimeloyl-ACP methyl ester carboxylesterase
MKFQADLPNDTLVILDKTGHVPMEEAPEATCGCDTVVFEVIIDQPMGQFRQKLFYKCN